MESAAAAQQTRNAQTRHARDEYGPHRQLVMKVISHAQRHDVQHLGTQPQMRGGNRLQSLCLLGVGNGNDVELNELVTWFERVELVDIDGTAMHWARVQVPEGPRNRLHIHPTDVSGIFSCLGRSAYSGDADQLIRRAHDAEVTLPFQPCDVVVSSCMLTQLIDAAVDAVGIDALFLDDLASAIVDRHLRLLLELTADEGRAVLITDFVSSDTFPDLPDLPQHELRRAVARQLETGNFFVGMHPGTLKRRWLALAAHRRPINKIELRGPWRWQLGSRTLAVVALTAQLADMPTPK
ncbi:MAG: hypothetical protein R3E01_21975 [Pirellulaceae bacterium]